MCKQALGFTIHCQTFWGSRITFWVSATQLMGPDSLWSGLNLPWSFPFGATSWLALQGAASCLGSPPASCLLCRWLYLPATYIQCMFLHTQTRIQVHTTAYLHTNKHAFMHTHIHSYTLHIAPSSKSSIIIVCSTASYVLFNPSIT